MKTNNKPQTRYKSDACRAENQISFRVIPKMYMKIKKFAKDNEITVSELMIAAVTDYIKRIERAQKAQR